MCGIAGIVGRNGLAAESEAVVRRMVEVIRHRGPDDCGTYCDSHAALGHARLSIIDLDSGKQPLGNEDGTVLVVFNGEIYNYKELRADLMAKGHKFKTNSDTETIVHLYEEHGERCVEFLNGMFAFGVWDARKRELLLARDRLGIKPLYYCVQGDTLVFGSELKTILQLPEIRREINPQAMLDYLTFGWIPAPKTIFSGVQKLSPAHTAQFSRNGLKIRQYWDFDDSEVIAGDDSEIVEKFVSGLSESVNRRLVADVPVGAFLSGGLDSSAVVATMSRLMSRPVITNSVGFDEREFSELPYADAVAKRFSTDHRRETVTADAVGIIDTLTWHWDEPFADSSAVPTYYVSAMARQNVKVVLSGDGGDENLAGYRRYKLSERSRIIRNLCGPSIRKAVFTPLAKFYPKADWLPRIFRAKSTFKELSESEVHAICRSRALLQPEISRQLLNGDLKNTIGDYDVTSVIDEHYQRSRMKNSLNRELYVDIKTFLVDDILTKVDRASMAVGLEVRVPLLDHRLVEFMAAVPQRLKYSRGEGKRLLKMAFRPALGSDIVDRTKQGFSIPLNKWMRGPLRSQVEDVLFSSGARVNEWLEMGQVQKYWNALQSGVSRCEALIWTVFMLELWAKRFLTDGVPQK